MFKIDDFFEKIGVFRKKIKMKFAGTRKKWAILKPKIAFDQIFIASRGVGITFVT